jgi:hypothetical protein
MRAEGQILGCRFLPTLDKRGRCDLVYRDALDPFGHSPRGFVVCRRTLRVEH